MSKKRDAYTKFSDGRFKPPYPLRAGLKRNKKAGDACFNSHF